MSKSFLILATLLAAGCINQEYHQERTQQITYTKDNRTGLCFGSLALGFSSAVLESSDANPSI